MTTDEIKAHLYIEHDDDDALLDAYIASAQEKVEGWIGARMVPVTVAWTLPCFAPRMVPPIGPIRSVEAITYIDPDGSEQALASTAWRIGFHVSPFVILPARGEAWPDVLKADDAVTIEAIVGYAQDGSETPASAFAAIRYLVTQFYRDRTGGASMAAYTRARQMVAGHAF